MTTFLFLALAAVIVIGVFYYTGGDPANVYKGLFIHQRYDNLHYPVESYSGLSVKGYRCHKCGYKWYVKKP